MCLFGVDFLNTTLSIYLFLVAAVRVRVGVKENHWFGFDFCCCFILYFLFFQLYFSGLLQDNKDCCMILFF